MATIIVTTRDGETRYIAGDINDWPDAASVVEAHGFDPENVSFEVDDPQSALEKAIVEASTLEELKSALTSNEHPAQARRRGPNR